MTSPAPPQRPPSPHPHHDIQGFLSKSVAPVDVPLPMPTGVARLWGDSLHVGAAAIPRTHGNHS